MGLFGRFLTAFVTMAVLNSQTADDPVMKAKAQRGSEDLPAVPRSIIEPPPLSPPETHQKDTRGYRSRVSKAKKKGKRSKRGIKAYKLKKKKGKSSLSTRHARKSSRRRR